MSDLRLHIKGPVVVDGTTVYIGGMDLASILRASMPGYGDPKATGRHLFPDVTLSVEAEYVERKRKPAFGEEGA